MDPKLDSRSPTTFWDKVEEKEDSSQPLLGIMWKEKNKIIPTVVELKRRATIITYNPDTI